MQAAQTCECAAADLAGSSHTSRAGSITPLPQMAAGQVQSAAWQAPGHAASSAGGEPPGPPGSQTSEDALKPSPQTAGVQVHSSGMPGAMQRAGRRVARGVGGAVALLAEVDGVVAADHVADAGRVVARARGSWRRRLPSHSSLA